MQEPFATPGNNARNDLSQDLLRAVSGRDVNAQLPVVTRTRRAIRVADENRREQGERGRRHIGITLFAFGAIFLVLAPAMWGSIDDLVDGEHFTDLPTQVALLSTLLMLSVMAALIAVWRSRSGNDGFRQDH